MADEEHATAEALKSAMQNPKEEVGQDEEHEMTEAEADESELVGDESQLDGDMSHAEGVEETEADLSGFTGEAIDTTAEFLKIFQGKTEFDSWQEFHTPFEQFQKETGSAFKPRSATSIEYANERRVRELIPQRFVYATVKMVCAHFGMPTPRISAFGKNKTKQYVGRGCEAMVHLRYKAGTINIVGCNLEHKNHALFTGNEVIRSIRSFSYTDELDLLMAKVVMEHNPFAHWNSEKEWMALVQDLQSRDETLRSVTIRLVKKRIRFLMDRYMANSNGKTPLPDDEMGIILYELAKAKEDAADNVANKPRKQGKKRGRPRKYPRPESDDEEIDALMDMDESETYVPEKRVKVSPSPSAPSGSGSIKDIGMFLRYMERRDENDRQLKQADMDLRRGELELHQKEFDLQRERFEFDRLERQAHLDLLKAQLDLLTSHTGHRTQHQQLQQQQTQKLVVADPKGDGSGVTEYTIVVNNDGHTFTTQ